MNTSLATYNHDNLTDLVDYSVVNRNGDSIGTVECLWTDRDNGQLEFLGVKTAWIFGSNHVVPVQDAHIDTDAQTIQVPYDLDLVKDAPAVDADAEISDAQEAEIYRYYSIRRGAAQVTGQPAVAAKSGLNTAIAATAARVGGAPVATPDPRTAAVAPVAARQTTGTTARVGENIEVPLSEEQIKVGKRTVESGSVRLRKIVRIEKVNVPVELRREDVVIERVPASEVKAGTAAAFEDKDIAVTLHREEAVIAKDVVTTGAVRVRKTEDVETRTVSDSVRKEDVEVVRDGKTEVRRDDTLPNDPSKR